MLRGLGVGLVGILLGCAGLGGKDDEGQGLDPADRPPLDETPTGTTDTTVASDACETYLACIGVTSPSALPAIEEGYGDGSGCWDDASSADRCTGECLTALELLQQTNPTVEACFEGVGNLQPCGLVNGTWVFEVETTAGECGTTSMDWLGGTTDIDCTDPEGRVFEAESYYGQDEYGDLYYDIDCVIVGDQIQCGTDRTEPGLGIVATLSVTGAVMEGEWTSIQDGSRCEESGVFTATY